MLPIEVWYKILNFLTVKDLKNIRICSKLFQSIGNEILFRNCIFNRKLKLDDLFHLPIAYLNNRYISHWTPALFPQTLKEITLSNRSPIIEPKTVVIKNHIKFLLSTSYILPANVYHLDNYVYDNVLLFTDKKRPLRFRLLNKYKNFAFRYIDIQYLTKDFNNSISAEEGINILKEINIQRLALTRSHFIIKPEQLTEFKNIICLTSGIFNLYQIFPFHYIPSSVEFVYLEPNTLVRESELKSFIGLRHTPIHLSQVKDGIQRVLKPLIICLKQVKDPLGQRIIDGPKWKDEISDLFGLLVPLRPVRRPWHTI